jgi:hypothetical protein
VAFDLDTTRRLQEIRAKSLRNEATMEELQEGFRILRADREGASVGATKARSAKAAAKAPVDTASVLDKLKGLTSVLKNQTHEG